LLGTLASLKQKSTIQDVFLSPKLEALQSAVSQLLLLGKKYHCVVDNPPYMGGGNMNKELADFVKHEYPKAKADLMTCFMETGLKVLEPKGFLGMINQHSWMFLSSYEKLRESLIGSTFIDTLLHLGPRTFPEIGGEVVQNASFTFWNNKVADSGKFIRLVDYGNSALKQSKTLEAINNPDCGWYYTANQKDFEKIPGSPIGYWLKNPEVFDNERISEDFFSGGRNKTHNNIRFVRYFWETCGGVNWEKYSNGGDFKRWYGNEIYILRWDDWSKNYYHMKGGLLNPCFLFKKGVTWNLITSAYNGFRLKVPEAIYSSGSPTIFNKNFEYDYFVLGFLNTKVAQVLLKMINPTLNTTVGDVLSLPIIRQCDVLIESFVQSSIELSREQWDSTESSWDFLQNELIRIKGHDLEESLDLYQQYWTNKFYQLHHNEEELNAQFIEIYGLQEELTP
ncbi:MAG: class I SAM-dependent DNA methyltransferase, partial [Bacteroidia bacterium]|nr:class I SAM-dependent DNA methyltransferase [Bacteroidia bacterium]